MLDERTKLKLSLVSWPISFKFFKNKFKLNRKKLKLIKNRSLELGFSPKYINITKMTLEQKDLFVCPMIYGWACSFCRIPYSGYMNWEWYLNWICIQVANSMQNCNLIELKWSEITRNSIRVIFNLKRKVHQDKL